jgi:hypothetical protein
MTGRPVTGRKAVVASPDPSIRQRRVGALTRSAPCLVSCAAEPTAARGILVT